MDDRWRASSLATAHGVETSSQVMSNREMGCAKDVVEQGRLARAKKAEQDVACVFMLSSFSTWVS